MQTLKAFEAAGRRLSMSLAADELHLTHGAISRHIKTLEDFLGLRLFRRLTRKIELTEAGADYHITVTRFLSDLARETQTIRRKNDRARMVVSTGVSFASKWLTRRLHRLMARYPDLEIHLEVTDIHVDFRSGLVDVAVRYGSGPYAGADVERMMDETVTPVCTPEYRERMGGLTVPADLLDCRLLHENRMNANWDRWLEMMGLDAASAARGSGYSHGSMSIEAATRSEGVALGRSVLVAEDLAEGRLVSLFPEARLPVEWGYDLVYRTGHRNHPKVAAFRDWMVDEVREFLSTSSC